MTASRSSDGPGMSWAVVVAMAVTVGAGVVVKVRSPAPVPVSDGVTRAPPPAPVQPVAAPRPATSAEPEPSRELVTEEAGRVVNGTYVVGQGEDARPVAVLDRARVLEVAGDHVDLEDGRRLKLTAEDRARLPFAVGYERSGAPVAPQHSQYFGEQ